MKKFFSILLVGGSGQFGITLAKILKKKNFDIHITSRNITKAKKKFDFKNKFKFHNLNVLDKKKIKKLISKLKPAYIFYLAGQSSPHKSFFTPSETLKSNYIGCKNFLEILKLIKLKCKFFNASSCEIFGNKRLKISINTKKSPVSPYGVAKLNSFNITKKYRLSYELKTYNMVIFNTESYYRQTNFLIPKICLAAINAKFYNKKTSFGNLNISREWNWCDKQCETMIKFISKKPQDFILSNGKNFTAFEMLKFAFNYFNLNYKQFIFIEKKHLRKKDIKFTKSNFNLDLIRNKITRKDKIYGKVLIHKLIKYYLKKGYY